MSEDFSGRTALITGAASGIGAAVAHWLDARNIARLVLVDRDAEGLAALHLDCEVQRCVGDVADEALWDGLAPSLLGLDHAVLNAGVADGCPIVSLEFAEWRRILHINLDGMFLSLRAALKGMTGSGTTQGRSVVLTSSIAGVKPLAGTAAYGASKAAVAHLARIAAADHAKDGLRVNAVAPGRVDTPIWTRTTHFQDLVRSSGSREAALSLLAEESTPLGRVPSAAEMAGQIGFLLSDAAWNITGTVLVSDGGFSL
jgi:NAD(P)-dependent dehydrogenase (short-subunit alcohol dehydrogenase family)